LHSENQEDFSVALGIKESYEDEIDVFLLVTRQNTFSPRARRRGGFYLVLVVFNTNQKYKEELLDSAILPSICIKKIEADISTSISLFVLFVEESSR